MNNPQNDTELECGCDVRECGPDHKPAECLAQAEKPNPFLIPCHLKETGRQAQAIVVGDKYVVSMQGQSEPKVYTVDDFNAHFVLDTAGEKKK